MSSNSPWSSISDRFSPRYLWLAGWPRSCLLAFPAQIGIPSTQCLAWFLRCSALCLCAASSLSTIGSSWKNRQPLALTACNRASSETRADSSPPPSVDATADDVSRCNKSSNLAAIGKPTGVFTSTVTADAVAILKCDQCGGDMKIIAIIPASEATEALLRLPAEYLATCELVSCRSCKLSSFVRVIRKGNERRLQRIRSRAADPRSLEVVPKWQRLLGSHLQTVASIL